jgi:hypothetical protein
VGGLNVLDGGTSASGIPGRNEGKFGMSPEELRRWGTRYLEVEDLCAFFLWRYDSTYFARPAIQAAVADLAAMARNRPNKACRP